MNYEVGKYYATKEGHRAECICNRPTRSEFILLTVFAVEIDDDIVIATPSGRFYRKGGLPTVSIVGPWIDKPIVDWSKMPAWFDGVIMFPRQSPWQWSGYYGSRPYINDELETWMCPPDAYWFVIPEAYAPKWTGDWRDSLVERPKK